MKKTYMVESHPRASEIRNTEYEYSLIQIYDMDSGNAMELDSHVDPNELSFLRYFYCFSGRWSSAY